MSVANTPSVGPVACDGIGGAAYRYTAFGLNILSCIPCPELLESDGGAPDVTVEYGHVPRELPQAKSKGVRYQACPGQLLLDVDGVARFLVTDGQRIVVDRQSDASDDCVRLFLLGSAFGALLHQRGSLVFHGSTIRVDDGCVVFLGRSGTGKSTLATALRRRGYPCLGDDLCSVDLGEDGAPRAVPAYPQAKLWADTLDQMSLDASKLRRVRPAIEKHALHFRENFSNCSLPINKVYVLTPVRNREEIALRPITGPSKMRILRDYTYRLQFLEGLERHVAHFSQLAKISTYLPAVRVFRPVHGFMLEELADAVEQDFRS